MLLYAYCSLLELAPFLIHIEARKDNGRHLNSWVVNNHAEVVKKLPGYRRTLFYRVNDEGYDAAAGSGHVIILNEFEKLTPNDLETFVEHLDSSAAEKLVHFQARALKLLDGEGFGGRDVVYDALDAEGTWLGADADERAAGCLDICTEDPLEADGDKGDDSTVNGNNHAKSDLFSPGLTDVLVTHAADAGKQHAHDDEVGGGPWKSQDSGERQQGRNQAPAGDAPRIEERAPRNCVIGHGKGP